MDRTAAGTLKDAVLERLRQDIITGALRPGTIVSDLELAKRYGASTTPVREALMVLAGERLIDMPANRAKRIAPLERKTSLDLFEFYRVLATHSFDKGSRLISQAEIEKMRQVIDEIDPNALVERRSVPTFISFLTPVYGAAGNAEIVRMLQNCSSWLQRLTNLLGIASLKAEMLEGAREILNAVEAGQADKAIRLHQESLDHFEGQISAIPDIH